MPTAAHRLPRVVAVFIALALVISGCTTTSGSGGGSGEVEPLGAIPEAAEIDALSAEIPEEPIAAAGALSAIVHGADRDRAVVATTEILRRAGFPIVTGDGHVLALPDEWMARNHAVYVEFVPALTAQVRAGAAYEAPDVAEFFTALGLAGEPFDEDVVVGTFANWGKDETDPPETRFAGAVSRASAWQRGELFTPDRSAARIDPLQFTLLTGHATAFTVPVPLGDPSGGKGMTRRAHHGLVGDTCAAMTTQADEALAQALDDPTVKDGIEKVLGSSPHGSSIGQQTNDVLRGYGRDRLRDGVKHGVRGFGVGIGKGAGRHAAAAVVASWDRATFTFDTATGTLSAALLLLGARLSLTSSADGIHFWHEANSDGLLFTATATFSSPVAAARLSCAALFGITIPADGPLKDFTIRWGLDQDVMPGTSHINPYFQEGKYLAPLKGQGSKLTQGERTNAGGQSVFMAIPRQESNPGVGAVHEAAVGVTAKLDKNELPFALKDLMSLANPAGVGGAAVAKTVELAQQLLTKLGLPSATKNVTVEYHAPDIYTIDAEGKLSFLWTGVEFFSTAAYSCDGITGPWHADSTFRAEIGPAIETAAQLLEVPITQRETNLESTDATFTLETTTAEQIVGLGMENINLAVTLTQLPTDDTTHIDGVVGTGSWAVDDAAVDQLLAFKPISMFSSGLRYPIVGVDQHPKCPGGLADDHFFIH